MSLGDIALNSERCVLPDSGGELGNSPLLPSSMTLAPTHGESVGSSEVKPSRHGPCSGIRAKLVVAALPNYSTLACAMIPQPI